MITVIPDSNEAVYTIRAVKIGDAILKVKDISRLFNMRPNLELVPA